MLSPAAQEPKENTNNLFAQVRRRLTSANARAEFQILQLAASTSIYWPGKEPAMTTHVLQFVELSDQERKAAKPLDKLGKGDHVEVKVRRKSGQDQVVRLPPAAATLLETALGHLLQGERVAILAEDQELSPNDAADILGISRPLVVHRMDGGDLAFRYVGKHRRTKLKDVLALKARLTRNDRQWNRSPTTQRTSGGAMAFEPSIAVLDSCILYP